MHAYDFEIQNAKNELLTLSNNKGKMLLLVNVASKCGYTPQYEGLEALYKKHKDKLEILAFPCNQFGGQEPGTEEEIQSFCSLTYNVSFPVLKKIEVNGDATHPLWAFLKEELPGLLGTKAIKWNFTKFWLDETGKPLKRFAPNDTPEAIEKEISTYLKSRG